MSSHTSTFLSERNPIYQKTSDLESKGHSVTIGWIPRHVRLAGHDKADQSARDKAQKGGKPVERWGSLTHIKKRLIESHALELTRWHDVKIQERETSRRGFYIPRVESYQVFRGVFYFSCNPCGALVQR